MGLFAEAHATHGACDAFHGVDSIADDLAKFVETAGLYHADDVVGSCDAVDLNGLFE